MSVTTFYEIHDYDEGTDAFLISVTMEDENGEVFATIPEVWRDAGGVAEQVNHYDDPQEFVGKSFLVT